jgi:dipeptidyl aminopeptidase/acylaminoacyl peptidase
MPLRQHRPHHGRRLGLCLLVMVVGLGSVVSSAAATQGQSDDSRAHLRVGPQPEVHASLAAAALPRNGALAFVRNNRIFRSTAAGTSVRALTAAATSRVKNHAPVFSPDGRRIAFVREVEGVKNLWIMRADGTGKRQITSMGGVGRPSWSADGRQLAFADGVLRTVRTSSPYPVATVVGRQCNDPSRPLEPVAASGAVGWSPNGRWIVFDNQDAVFCDSPKEYFQVLDLWTQLVDTIWAVDGECCGYGYFANPTFSSDSTLLAYEWLVGWPWEPPTKPTVDVMTWPQEVVLAELRPGDRMPAFSPDQRYVLVSTWASGKGELWRMTPTGADRRKVTNGYQASWQPLR